MAELAPAIEEQIATSLLDIGAVSLKPNDPFTWASGLRSPVYCDNRLVMGYPEIREAIAAGFAAILKSREIVVDVIAGTATAGIPHAAWLASIAQLPMIYVRSKPKAHGRKNQIEGAISTGQSAVVVEDLISTGKSSIAAVEALLEEGVEVKAVLAIFSYGFDEASAVFKAAGIPHYTLTTFGTLIKIAEQTGHIQASDLETLKAWRKNPRSWSEQFFS